MLVEKIKEFLKSPFFSGGFPLKKIALSLLVIIIFFVIHRMVLIFIKSQSGSVKSKYRVRKVSAYLSSFSAFIIILFIWAEKLSQFVTIIGLFSAGLAVAMKDIIVDWIGWLFIILRRPFNIGDRVEVTGVKGDVVDIRTFQFSLLEVGNWVESDQSTGRVVHIPNRYVFSHHLVNYNNGFGFIWNEIPVLITFESNWAKAKNILSKIADEHSVHFSQEAKEALKKKMARFMIYYKYLNPKVYTTVKESGVLLTIRYLCKPKMRRVSEEEIWEEILRVFSEEPEISLAYPTYRVYSPFLEKKDED